MRNNTSLPFFLTIAVISIIGILNIQLNATTSSPNRSLTTEELTTSFLSLQKPSYDMCEEICGDSGSIEMNDYTYTNRETDDVQTEFNEADQCLIEDLRAMYIER